MIVKKKDAPSEITKFEDSSLWIKKQVLRFYISMACALRMYVWEAPEQLVHVQLWNKTEINTEFNSEIKKENYLMWLRFGDILHPATDKHSCAQNVD